MTHFTACTDSFFATPPQTSFNCLESRSNNDVKKDQQYWNPNSERYETMQQLIERGRVERSIAFTALFGRLFRAII